jgi:hypothetical protein
LARRRRDHGQRRRAARPRAARPAARRARARRALRRRAADHPPGGERLRGDRHRLAAEELEHARWAAAAAGVEPEFGTGDLRDLPDVGPVDGIVSWGNSFGYLIPRNTASSLAGMRRALRPGGRLVLESLTVAESLLVGGVKPVAEREFGGVRMTAHNVYRASESRLESDYVFEDASGAVETARAAHHVHTSGELVRMLGDAGFTEVELRGQDGRGAYELGAPRLIVVAVA